jgi:hypothetical protein
MGWKLLDPAVPPDEPYSLSQLSIEVRLDPADHPGSVSTPSRSHGVLRGIISSPFCAQIPATRAFSDHAGGRTLVTVLRLELLELRTRILSRSVESAKDPQRAVCVLHLNLQTPF